MCLLSILTKSNLNIFIKTDWQIWNMWYNILRRNFQELLYHIKAKHTNYKITERSDKIKWTLTTTSCDTQFPISAVNAQWIFLVTSLVITYLIQDIFKLSQIWEVLRFVDGITAVYKGDGIIGLTCKNKTIKSKNNIKEKT